MSSWGPEDKGIQICNFPGPENNLRIHQGKGTLGWGIREPMRKFHTFTSVLLVFTLSQDSLIELKRRSGASKRPFCSRSCGGEKAARTYKRRSHWCEGRALLDPDSWEVREQKQREETCLGPAPLPHHMRRSRPQKPVHDVPRGGIVCPVQEGWQGAFLKRVGAHLSEPECQQGVMHGG